MRRRRKSFLSEKWFFGVLIVALVFVGVVGCSIFEGKGKKVAPPASKAEKTEVVADVKTITEKEPPKQEEKKPEQKLQTSYSVVIDKAAFQLTLYKKGIEVRRFPVAVGLKPGQKKEVGDMTTPTGKFTVDEICEASTWTHDFGDGKGVIKGAYGPWFISLATPPWEGIGIHGTHDPKSIGTRASEGCIRMNNEDVAWLKKYVTVGMPVEIKE